MDLFYTCYYFVTGMNRGIKMIFVHRSHKAGYYVPALFQGINSSRQSH